MEIAYVSANKLKIEIESKKSRFLSTTLGVFLHNPAQYISTMLIGNNAILVIYSMFMAILLEPFIKQHVANQWIILIIQTAISTIIILLTGEFTAKALFSINPNKALKTFAAPTALFYIIIYPISKFTTFVSNLCLWILTGKKNFTGNKTFDFDRYDLSDLVVQHQDQTNKENHLTSKRNIEMFQNVLDFHGITVRECIVPRNELAAIETNDSLDTLTSIFTKTGFSRILVFENSIDNIVGYVHASDMFDKPVSIKSVIHQMDIVPETMPANKLLKKFIKKHQSMALVVDEFGGTSGVVTLEDILEEIIGEIQDEHDIKNYEESQIDPDRFLFSGRLETDYLNEKYGLELDKNDQYETLAGYILHHYRNIPKNDQIITIKKYKFKIVKASDTQIKTVELTV